MKVQIESAMQFNFNIDAQEELELLINFNHIIKRCLNAEKLEDIKVETFGFWMYKGSTHIAIHQVINNKPSDNRLLLVTE